jgi:hypothetical protein
MLSLKGWDTHSVRFALLKHEGESPPKP